MDGYKNSNTNADKSTKGNYLTDKNVKSQNTIETCWWNSQTLTHTFKNTITDFE
ncbi:hypothetical protein CHS0354_001517, partial [Potamilus streckersoni]